MERFEARGWLRKAPDRHAPLTYPAFSPPAEAPAADRPTSFSWSLGRPALALRASISWRILSIPPALFDQHVIDVGAIRQEHIGNGASVLVLTEYLERDFLPDGEI